MAKLNGGNMKKIGFIFILYIMISTPLVCGRRIQEPPFSIIQKIDFQQWLNRLKTIKETLGPQEELSQIISQFLHLDTLVLEKLISMESVLKATLKLTQTISEGENPNREEIDFALKTFKKAYNYLTFIPRLQNGQIPVNEDIEVLVHSYGISFYNHKVYFEFSDELFKKYQDFLLRVGPSGIVTVIGITSEGERHILAGTAIVDLIAPSANRSFEVIRNLSEGIKLKTGLVWNDILIVAKEGAEEQCEITYREFNTSFQRELQKALSWIEKFYRGNCKQKFKYTSVIEIYPTPASFLGFITGGTIGENGVVRVETSGNSFNLAFRILHENVHLWFRSFNLTQPLLKDKELAIRSTRFFQEYWDKYRNVLLILTEICAYLEHSMFVSWILNQPQIQKETPMVKWKYVRSQRNGFLKDLNEQIDLIEEEVFQKNFFTPYGEQFFKRIKSQFQHLYRDVLKL